MKYIITLLLAFVSTLCFAQLDKDTELYAKKTTAVETSLERLIHSKRVENRDEAYATIKVKSLDFLNFSEEEKKIYIQMFKNQYSEFYTRYNQVYNINKKKKDKRDKELITIIIKNEDAFRSTLSQDRLKLYTETINKNSENNFLLEVFFQNDTDISQFKEWIK